MNNLEIKNISTTGLIDEGTIDIGEIFTYELILWIDYDANPNNQTFNKCLKIIWNLILNMALEFTFTFFFYLYFFQITLKVILF